MIRKIIIFLALILSPIFFTIRGYSQNQEGSADKARSLARLKTAFIYNFTKYITWPNEDKLTEFKICVLKIEAKELGQQLDKLAALRKFKDKTPIKIIYCSSSEDLPPCQMVVISGYNKDLVPVYNKIKGKGTLMVAENLMDYKKSIISFVEVDNHMNFIINATRMAESRLTVNPGLYKLAITKEEEWKNIFEKFKTLLGSGQEDVVVTHSDLKQMISQYKSLTDQNKLRDTLINRLEDTLKLKMKLYNEKVQEYARIGEKIEQGKQLLHDQEVQVQQQKNKINLQANKITLQNMVIAIIAFLSLASIILLFLAIRNNRQRKKANMLLSEQKQLVESKQKEIVDSINYARRIQMALLPNDKMLTANLPEHFILFLPKDIVAGDFYWATPSPDGFIFITADCTGHGVPGAFMSLLNISKLNEAINQKHITRPDLVLNYLRQEIIQALNSDGNAEESKDGMDATLCKIDLRNMKLEFAAANTSFCIIRNKELLMFRADKIPVGKWNNDLSLFTYNQVALQKGDMIFTYTDGFTSQFGGPKGKKFKVRQLKELFLAYAELPVQAQKQEFQLRFEEWKGQLEQVDDVLVMGIKV